MRPALPASDYYGPSAPPPGYQQTACLPAATLEWAAVRGPGGGSHVHHRPVDGGGVQLFPCSIATTTPQAFTVASRKGLPHPARESPVASVPRACAAARPPIHQVGAGGPLEGVPPLVSALVHLPVSLAGPGPSGGAGPSRRCQSCSHPAPCLRGQAALSFKRTAATARRWVPSSHPVEWRLVAHGGVGPDLPQDRAPEESPAPPSNARPLQAGLRGASFPGGERCSVRTPESRVRTSGWTPAPGSHGLRGVALRSLRCPSHFHQP